MENNQLPDHLLQLKNGILARFSQYLKNSQLDFTVNLSAQMDVYAKAYAKEYWQVQGLEDRIFAMDNAIGCLALELHEDIWNDVNKRWQLLKQQLSTPPSSDKVKEK